MRNIKSIDRYVNNIVDNENLHDEIIVEHRHNNPKRDFLFVNKIQGRHVPCKASSMINMCDKLAEKINAGLKKRKDYNDLKILVVCFPEAATAIGRITGDKVEKAEYILQATREEVADTKELLSFEEQHRPDATERILKLNDGDFDFDDYNYILFIEDEISTGNTILNFINEFEEKYNLDEKRLKKRNIHYGVATICNWQNATMKATFEVAGIDNFSLITGEIDNVGVKMLDGTDVEISNVENDYVQRIHEDTQLNLADDSIFKENRTGHKVNRTENNKELQKKIKEVADRVSKEYNSVRVIGTEECTEIPIKIAKALEDKGLDAICQSTTRSKLDILKGSTIGLTERYGVPSAYNANRNCYIYNLGNKKCDCTLLVTDSTNGSQMLALYNSLYSILEDESHLELVAL